MGTEQAMISIAGYRTKRCPRLQPHVSQWRTTKYYQVADVLFVAAAASIRVWYGDMWSEWRCWEMLIGMSVAAGMACNYSYNLDQCIQRRSNSLH